MMSYSHQFSSPNITDKNGCTGWYQHCKCCPYGYHIDLDFVRYCETIGQEADRTGSIKRRRDRRRQRQSMEVLLGLEPPTLLHLEQAHQKAIQEESPRLVRKQMNIKQPPLIQDDLDEVVSDFERTFQRSHKLSNNLPDVTAVHEIIRRVPSTSSMSSASGSSMTVLPTATDGNITRDFDAVSIESYGLSPVALQNIREQMALSLERTKELEERVKLIPQLQTQLSTLKEEKRQLLLQLKAEENARLNNVNGNYLNNSVTPPYIRLRSQSFTNIDSYDNPPKKEPPPPPPRRDFGVTCSVLMRHVGVGHQYPNTRTVATAIVNGELDSDHYSDKWFNEKIKFLNEDSYSTSLRNNQLHETQHKIPVVVAKGTQTTLPKEKRDSGSQTLDIKSLVQKIKSDSGTQTVENKTSYRSFGVLATVNTQEAGVGTVVKTKTLGVSDNTINDIFCSKCRIDKKTVAVGPDKIVDGHISPISLASLTVPRSKSFNLGGDKLNLSSKNRTVGCQYESTNLSKACQHEPETYSKACQNEIKTAHKSIQYESNCMSKNTDTKDLNAAKKHVACNTKDTKFKTVDVACNTINVVEKMVEKVVTPCTKCSKREKEDNKKDDSVMPSRIPRLQMPTTPVENRKFRRQDTYTKISPSSGNENQGLSGLDLSARTDNEVTSSFDKVKQNYKLPEVSNSKVEQVTPLPLSENVLYHPIAQTHRKKAVPSKEMQAAMKVLNDSLQKGQTKNLKSQLKNAINIIEEEWFKISSLVTANPLDVEDYLDCFEDISCDLLRYVVNMVDASGNTAMHYAVSHGNFDVVSILLDSKVCDINQPNKAGYTSVMLVSLAEVRSPTHANVVRRLFQLADVNIRAKQHGQTALMLAVSHGRLDMVTMLLEAGADINIQDEDGSTALMCSAEHGHVEIVKHFLNQPECDSSITDVDGSTALKIAMEAGHRHIGVLLYAHERNLHGSTHSLKQKKTKPSVSPKPPSSPLSLRSSHRALADSKTSK